MKIAKILSAAAACAVAATALAVSASAELTVVEGAAAELASTTGRWAYTIYCPNENVPLNINPDDIKGVRFTIKADEPEWFEGQTGGAIIVSCGPVSVTPEDHNWASTGYWGVIDEDLELDTHDDTAAVQFTRVGDYTYAATLMFDDSNRPYGEVTSVEDGWCKINLDEWGTDMSAMSVVSLELLDASGATFATVDAMGNLSMDSAPSTPSTPDEPSDNNTAAPSTPSNSGDKGSPDTGVAGVAAAAGVAVLAAGAVVLTKKRK
ncbi:MAG: NPXTG-anchored protein [Oscillospiraceae bacterium]|nr:NPXTG-anchored protein [Oscillospiraceae bacterium]